MVGNIESLTSSKENGIVWTKRWRSDEEEEKKNLVGKVKFN